MNLKSQVTRIVATILMATSTAYVTAQQAKPPSQAEASAGLAIGPHGGTMRRSEGVQLETLVSQGGVQLFVYDSSGKPILAEKGRGVASIRVTGNAKRYRYDLLPDGNGGLTAPANLAKFAGRQVELDIQVVGISVASGRITLKELASIPPTAAQLAAVAIARQKLCPVSGKRLGSMGEPVAVTSGQETVYVCCAACTNAVKADPAKYIATRLQVTVAIATEADAALIKRQANCPVMDEALGSMGQPVKLMVGDKPIFLCCKGCIKKVRAEPAKYLASVYGEPIRLTDGSSVPAGVEQVREGIFRVTDDDTRFITAQKRCPVMDEPLDAMGGPYKVNAAGKAIYICCPGCAKKIAAEPKKYLAILAEQGVKPPTLR